MFSKIINFFQKINSISTPFGGVGWEKSKSHKLSSSTEEHLLPRTYPADLVRKIVKNAYDETTGFIAVKYGSKDGNDEDYLVLVFSKPTENDPMTLLLSHADKTWQEGETAIDLTIREFHSFVFGLILGRPYEHSVVEDGEPVDSLIVPKSYWSWIESLKDNIQINSVSLQRHLLDVDLVVALALFSEGQNEKDIHKVIVGAYSATSILLQTRILSKMDGVLYTEDIYSLSKVDHLKTTITNDNILAGYSLIVSAAKRSIAPSNPNEFIKICKITIQQLKSEVINEKW